MVQVPRTPNLLTLALLAVLAWLGASTRVAADDEAQQRARVFFERGLLATARGAYSDALAAFEQAYALLPHPVTLYNVALSHWALDRPGPALHWLEHALAHGELSGDKRKQMEAQRAQWLSQVARVRVAVVPREARTRLDGKILDSGGTLVLAPGWQQFDVECAGYQTSTHRLYLRPGTQRTVRVTLEAVAAAASDMAALEAVTFPYGKIWVNGAFAGDSPVRLKLPAGSYRVGGGRELPEGEVTLELRPRESRQLVVHWDRERSTSPP